MSEFRKDPVSEHWVIIAPNRAARPEQLEAGAGAKLPQRCPFCRGHEDDTPPAVAAYGPTGRLTDRGDWQVRVVPNKHPAVGPAPKALQPGGGFYDSRPGVGVHEVIVEAPDHVSHFSALDGDAAALVFAAYRDRLAALAHDPRLAYGQVFKNSGAAAGASLEHTHSQLIGTSVVPTQVRIELAKAQQHWRENARCVFCEMIRRELEAGVRMVAESRDFVAFCPFASQFPYETWVLPRQHASRFESVDDGSLKRLARLVKALISCTKNTLNDPAFNYLIHTSPFRADNARCYHWHVEFFPRLTRTAGFEWGAGDYINTVSPEEAAARLRAVLPASPP